MQQNAVRRSRSSYKYFPILTKPSQEDSNDCDNFLNAYTLALLLSYYLNFVSRDEWNVWPSSTLDGVTTDYENELRTLTSDDFMASHKISEQSLVFLYSLSVLRWGIAGPNDGKCKSLIVITLLYHLRYDFDIWSI